MTDAENIEKAADRSLDKQELLQLSTEGDPGHEFAADFRIGFCYGHRRGFKKGVAWRDVNPKPLAESDEKNEFAALCRRLGEKGPIARVDLQVARYVANKLYQKYGWDATRANDPRVTELVEAARQVEEWFDISNPERVGFKRGPGDLIPNDSMAAGAVISVIEALRKFERGGT